MTTEKNLLNLPFDQYTRQKIVAEMIDELRRTSSVNSFSVLDIGGYKGATKEFLPNDDVSVLDVYDINEDKYIKGDGTNLPFKDESFDILCSFDVLEHIPRNQRKTFIAESVRVSKHGVFIACPFEAGDNITRSTEKNLNIIYESINNEDHRWLKEHLDNKLPSEEEIETILRNQGVKYIKQFTNHIEDWTIIQFAFFMATLNREPSLEIGGLNIYYNKNFEKLEAGLGSNNSYRVIYFISNDEECINSINLFLKQNLGVTYDNNIHTNLRLKAMKAIAESQSKVVHKLYEDNIQYKKMVNDILGSTSWKSTKLLRWISGKLRKLVNVREYEKY